MEELIVTAVLTAALAMVVWRIAVNLRIARGAEGGGCAGGCDCPAQEPEEASAGERFSV